MPVRISLRRVRIGVHPALNGRLPRGEEIHLRTDDFRRPDLKRRTFVNAGARPGGPGRRPAVLPPAARHPARIGGTPGKAPDHPPPTAGAGRLPTVPEPPWRRSGRRAALPAAWVWRGAALERPAGLLLRAPAAFQAWMRPGEDTALTVRPPEAIFPR